ncbi:hypothetical protein ABZ690_33420 [Streptomyces sp. NPDC006967]|uniref:hypothetical protein n=1 Tax=Streptomyces sp. NPDC006967 TaxID=3156906 RepID=UPI0034100C75
MESLGPTVPPGTGLEEQALLHAAWEQRHPTDLNVPSPAELDKAEKEIRQAQSAMDRAKAAGADPATVARLAERLTQLRETTRAMNAKVRSVDAEISAAARAQRAVVEGRPVLVPVAADREAVAEMTAALREAARPRFPERDGKQQEPRTSDDFIVMKPGWHVPKGQSQKEGVRPADVDGRPTVDFFTLLNHKGSMRFREGAKQNRFQEVDESGTPVTEPLHSHYRATLAPLWQVVEKQGEDGPTAELIIGHQLILPVDPVEREQQVGWAGRPEGPRD